jgi:hypothetical protein
MKPIIFFVISALIFTASYGQHEHHHEPKSAPKKIAKPVKQKPVTQKGVKQKRLAEDTAKSRLKTMRKDSVLRSNEMHHEHESMSLSADSAKSVPTASAKDTVPTSKEVHEGHQPVPADRSHHDLMEGVDHSGMSMSHAFSRNLPMTRNGSGTSWLPDNSPMYGYMYHKGKWMYMLHGNTFIRYNKQDLFNQGTRGDDKFDVPNMWMFMGQRNVGSRGLFHFSAMVSGDPFTVGEEGYPLLFQTGETYQGKPLIDRQHPHDLFSELSVSYAHALTDNSDLFIYLGYPGEPALGPSAYVHRPSGFLNPDAPLTHHWVDATHITFGVATVGFRYGNFKIEGSSFTGREPDENRYNFDKPRFDSWSGRLSFNPDKRWAMQVSHGFLKSPEPLHPGENVNRTTASVQYSSKGINQTFNNITALWGVNKTKNHSGEHGLLLEASRQNNKTGIYGRYEWVQKSVEELTLDETLFGHDAIFPIHAITAGGSYDLLNIGSTKLAIGAQLTMYRPDQRIAPLYGKNPFAGQIYLRLYPRALNN